MSGDSTGPKVELTLPPTAAVPKWQPWDDDYEYRYEKGFAEGWNACRKAMLEGDQS